MDPFVGEPFAATPDVHVIPTYWPVSEDSVLTINAFLLHAAEPVLVDTGAGVVSDGFVEALGSILPVERLGWIWITHEDLDHTGSLERVLRLAPEAKVVASASAVTRIEFERPLDAERHHPISPGETLVLGDRVLGAWQPPLFDSPATTGFLDRRSGALFSCDCFGASLPGVAEARVHSTADLPEDMVANGQLSWAQSDSPWVTLLDEDGLARMLRRIRVLHPTVVLSSHAAPIPEAHIERALATLSRAAAADPAAGLTTPQLAKLLVRLPPDA